MTNKTDTLRELGRINAMFPHLRSEDIAKIADLIYAEKKSALKQREEEMVKRLRHKIFDQGFVEERNGKKGITWSTRPTWTEVLGLIDTLKQKQHDKD